MISYRKTYEITGYTADADVYCIHCAIKTYGPDIDHAIDSEGNEVHPVFLGDETEYAQHCTECGEEVETVVINPESDETESEE